MKIIQILPNLAGGGGERFVVDLCNQLTLDHEVILITLYDMTEQDVFLSELDQSISVISLSKKKGFDILMFLKLIRKIKVLNPDIIHTHLRSLIYIQFVIPFLYFIPFVHTIHSDAFRECPSTIFRKIRKYFINNNKLTPVTISYESNLSFKKAYNSDKSVVIFNGRTFPNKSLYFLKSKKEVESLKHNVETQVFLNIARIHKVKNHILLVKSFIKLIEKENVNAILLIIGRPELSSEDILIYNELKELQKKHNSIYLLGQKNNATDYFYLSNYFCLSSTMEGMPITLLESMATKTIPVCTPVGGMKEMIEKVDYNLLSKSLTVKDYYKALRYSFNLPVEKKQVLQNSFKNKFEDEYCIKICARKYQDLYCSLINSK